MLTPHEAFGIPPERAERIARLPASDVATYMGAWLDREPGGAIEALAQSPQPDDAGLIGRFEGDTRAIALEFATRAVRNLLGSNARIVIGEDNG